MQRYCIYCSSSLQGVTHGNCCLDVHATIGGSVIDGVCCDDYLEADCSVLGDNDGCSVMSVA